VTAAEAAAVLRDVVDGRRPLRLKDPRRPWAQVAVGEVGFVAGDADLVFFSDSASLDHLASIRVAAARPTSFEDWLRAESSNPVDLLDDGERHALEQMLFAAA
jgi:hypothetical protein